ncbi:MAG: ABC-F family ATP-binding cassette domain-containing protein [bacterium]
MLQKKNLLQFQNLKLTLGPKIILDDVSGSINSCDRIGLIGANGSGKSSFLKLLLEDLKADQGTISKSVRIGYLPQIEFDDYRSKLPVWQYLAQNNPEWWQILISLEQVFQWKLDPEQPVNRLSGGELLKLKLCSVLAAEPELIFLDEPTNHLDLKAIKQLTALLKSARFAYLVVSHNVQFLNDTVEQIWHLQQGKIITFGGNYDAYQQFRHNQEMSRSRRYLETKKEIKNLQKVKVAEHKRAERSKQYGKDIVKTRKTDRFAEAYFKNRSEKKATQKKFLLVRKEEGLEEILMANKPVISQRHFLELDYQPKRGLIINIAGGKLAFNKKNSLLLDINFSLYHQDRIAILGDNGSGKTTFIKELAYQKRKFLLGDVQYGSEYQTLYLDQKYDLISPDISIYQNLFKTNSEIKYETLRKALGNLGFKEDFDLEKLAGSLSGGEIARLSFAIISLKAIDLLILDEPTNNLDLETITAIKSAINAYKGALIVVSHDERFLEGIGIQKYFQIMENQLRNS